MEQTQADKNQQQVSKTGKFEEVFKRMPKIYRSSIDSTNPVKISVQKSKETISIKGISI